MKSKVYFIDFRTKFQENIFAKLARLLKTAGLENCIHDADLTAIKLHFGELGNAAFIRPIFLRRIVESVRELKGKPFLTDANTLYAGTRSDTPTHLTTAIHNGFSYAVIDAPLVIADGLRGKSETAIPINGKYFKEVYIANEIVEADVLLGIAHFKGHELTGFGGCLKNLGMGCASRRGKMAQHAILSPKITRKKCIGCGDCEEHCSHGAIKIIDEKACIDSEKCTGCGECIIICQQKAVQINWDSDIAGFMQRMIEYTSGVLKNKKDKSLFVNFINNISPACDCMPHNDAPVVHDIGIVASKDPVAIDQASADLVNKAEGIASSCLKKELKSGEDKFRAIYPKIDWNIQLDYAQKFGLGSRDYELIKI
ncbi:4Fe-4S ferredoxin [Candidatus Magnetomoraceae bacterium gMMP-15]